MLNKGQIKIIEKDLVKIYGDDYHFFEEKIVPNCYCGYCKTPYNSTIVNYEKFIYPSNDIALKGFCKQCENPINRYIETSEVKKYNEAINKLKKV